jgi:hypothetical protein
VRTHWDNQLCNEVILQDKNLVPKFLGCSFSLWLIAMKSVNRTASARSRQDRHCRKAGKDSFHSPTEIDPPGPLVHARRRERFSGQRRGEVMTENKLSRHPLLRITYVTTSSEALRRVTFHNIHTLCSTRPLLPFYFETILDSSLNHCDVGDQTHSAQCFSLARTCAIWRIHTSTIPEPQETDPHI